MQTQHYRWVSHDPSDSGYEGFCLFDHRTDPGETNNIAAQYPELMAEMKRKYDAWYDDMIPTLLNDEAQKQIANGSIAKRHARLQAEKAKAKAEKEKKRKEHGGRE